MILRSQEGDGFGCEAGEGEGEGAEKNWRCEDRPLILASRKGVSGAREIKSKGVITER
jgi:hypothetical protein